MVFLPAAGYRRDIFNLQVGESGNYWSSNVQTYYYNTKYAYFYYFNKESPYWDYDLRHMGMSVRPVTD